jgi:hypothetical protein
MSIIIPQIRRLPADHQEQVLERSQATDEHHAAHCDLQIEMLDMQLRMKQPELKQAIAKYGSIVHG